MLYWWGKLQKIYNAFLFRETMRMPEKMFFSKFKREYLIIKQVNK